jgi:polyisoprenoid-binding protein YceI
MTTTKWTLDPMHSEITFKVKHLMISTVTGTFNHFNVNVESEDDDLKSVKEVDFVADIDSIDTNNAQRDAHLKSADFFNAEQHKNIVFSGTKYEANGEDGKLFGNLTIAGKTQPVQLNVEFGGIAKDGYGQTKAGFTVSGKINRKDFGITYGTVTETGGVLLGDDIKINAEIQLVKQVEQEVAEEQLANA